MAALPALTALMSIAGTGMGVMGQLQQGKAAQAAANYQAAWDRQEGKAEFAAAQRQAVEKQRELDAVQGRQLALAAASGAGVNNPTIADIYGQTAGRGDYNARTALYGGEKRKQAYNAMADDALFRGDVAQKAGTIGALATGLNGLSKVDWGSFKF